MRRRTNIKHKINKLTRKAFLTYFICIFAPLAILLSSLLFSNYKAKQHEYEAAAYIETENFLADISNKFSNITSSSNSIFSSRWYNHFMCTTDIYDHEFDVLKQLEISNTISTMISAMDFVKDIYIVSPSDNTIISSRGWYTFDTYGKYFSYISIESDGSSVAITDTDNEIFSLLLNDTNARKNKAVICIVCDKLQFSRYCKKLIGDNVQTVTLSINSTPIFEYSSSAANDRSGYHVNLAEYKYPTLYADISFNSYMQATMPYTALTNVIIFLSLALISIILAYILMCSTIKPVDELAQKINSAEYSSSKEAVNYINEYINSISYKTLQLSEENHNLSKRVSHFFSVMESEIIFSMLTNPDFDFHSDYIKDKIPWINDGLPFMLIRFESKHFSHNEFKLPRIPNELYLYSRTFKVLDGEYCTILWFQDRKSAEAHISEINNVLKPELSQNRFFMTSSIMTSTDEISDCYQTLVRVLQKQLYTSLELPTKLQIKLISSIQNSNIDECKSIISEAKEDYNPDSFFTLLLRMSYEYDVNSLETISLYENTAQSGQKSELWDIVINFANDIVSKISKSKRKRSDDTSTLIREFIDENYRDPSISIKMLADHFNLDGTLVSKIFKAESGMSFTDYLLEQRMKAAINMLEKDDLSISSISEAVGYTNYLTFKRAFIRFQGISPKEYRDMKFGNNAEAVK